MFVWGRLDGGLAQLELRSLGEFTKVVWAILDCEKLRISEASEVVTLVGVEECAAIFCIHENRCKSRF